MFEDLVARRKMPRPKRIGARVIYDRLEVDACFTDLDSAPANRIDELLGAAQQAVEEGFRFALRTASSPFR